MNRYHLFGAYVDIYEGVREIGYSNFIMSSSDTNVLKYVAATGKIGEKEIFKPGKEYDSPNTFQIADVVDEEIVGYGALSPAQETPMMLWGDNEEDLGVRLAKEWEKIEIIEGNTEVLSASYYFPTSEG